MHPHTKGRLAEALALAYFLAQGWLPAPRPKTAHVQTDLLLRRGQTLLIVEVKFRRSSIGRANALHSNQIKRLSREAHRMAALYPTYALRADVLHLTPQWPFFHHFPAAIPLAA